MTAQAQVRAQWPAAGRSLDPAEGEPEVVRRRR